MDFRNHAHRSLKTGTMAPIHHTPWLHALDDSMACYLNKVEGPIDPNLLKANEYIKVYFCKPILLLVSVKISPDFWTFACSHLLCICSCSSWNPRGRQRKAGIVKGGLHLWICFRFFLRSWQTVVLQCRLSQTCHFPTLSCPVRPTWRLPVTPPGGQITKDPPGLKWLPCDGSRVLCLDCDVFLDNKKPRSINCAPSLWHPHQICIYIYMYIHTSLRLDQYGGDV